MNEIVRWLAPGWPRPNRARPIHWAFVEWRALGKTFTTLGKSSPSDYELIVMSHGMIAYALSIFSSIFANPQNFPSIGDITLESQPPRLDLSINPLDWPQTWVTPRCPVRAAMARQLALLSLTIVAFHEVGHITNGHNDYKDSTGNPNDPVLSQTLEMDADSRCVQFALLWGERWRRHVTSHPAYDFSQGIPRGVSASAAFDLFATKSLFHTPSAMTISILFAGYLFFRGLAKPWNIQQQEGKTHPLPAIRMRFLADGIRLAVRGGQIADYNLADFDRGIGPAFHDIHLAFARLVQEPPDLDLWESTFRGKERDDYFFGVLIPKWAEIRSELDKFAKAEIAPVEWNHIPPEFLIKMPQSPALSRKKKPWKKK